MFSDGTQHLLVAILTRAVRDLKSPDRTIQAEAKQWLIEDPLCVEICEMLGVSVSRLHQTVGLPVPVKCREHFAGNNASH